MLGLLFRFLCFFHLATSSSVLGSAAHYISSRSSPSTAEMKVGGEQSSAPYISFVSLPLISHFEPLAAMAEEMYRRGYRVSVALPEGYESWVEKYAPNARYIPCGVEPSTEELEALTQISLVSLPEIGELSLNYSTDSNEFFDYPKSCRPGNSGSSKPDTAAHDCPPLQSDEEGNFFLWLCGKAKLPGRSIYDSVGGRLRYFASFQRPMLQSLTHAHGIDGPDLIVVDRFCFAGVASAHYHHIEYVISSPSLLLDIDRPPQYSPAPYSGPTLSTKLAWTNTFSSIPQRCLNLFYRILFRVAVSRALDDINAARLSFDTLAIPPILRSEQLYGRRVVLANTVFGIEDPRPLNSLVNMVGTIVSPTLHKMPDNAATWLLNSPPIENQNREPGTTALLLPIVVVHLIVGHGKAEEAAFLRVFDTIRRNNVMETLHRTLWVGTVAQETMFIKISAKHEITNAEQYMVLSNSVPQGTLTDVEESDDGVRKSRSVPFPLRTVLVDPRVNLLITSGDSFEVHTALLECTPVIVIPLLAEHIDIGKRLTRLKAGIMVNAQRGTAKSEDALETAIYTILFSPQSEEYKSAACRAGAMIRGSGGLGRATNILESVMTTGIAAFVERTTTMPWYSSLTLDVYIVYFAVLFGIWMICKTCWRSCSKLWSNIVPNPP